MQTTQARPLPAVYHESSALPIPEPRSGEYAAPSGMLTSCVWPGQGCICIGMHLTFSHVPYCTGLKGNLGVGHPSRTPSDTLCWPIQPLVKSSLMHRPGTPLVAYAEHVSLSC
jgi:hypothetical protein